MGCGLGQGYLVARPMAAHRIESFAVVGGAGPMVSATPVIGVGPIVGMGSAAAPGA
jgi:hypothetical protein